MSNPNSPDSEFGLPAAQGRGDSRATFKKPAYWTNRPLPRPAPADPKVHGPEVLSPTRFGDWVINGIAVDF